MSDAGAPTAGDLAEIASGKGSSGDKREAGFVKVGSRLVPGPHTPVKLKRMLKTKNGPTRTAIPHKSGRASGGSGRLGARL